MSKYINHHDTGSCFLDSSSHILNDPYHWGNPVCDGAFSSYVMSMEAAIDAVAALPDPNDPVKQAAALRQYGFCVDDMTDDEIEYMEKEIAKRYNYLQL